MSSATQSRWSRGFVAAGVGCLVAWQLAVVLGLPRRSLVALGLYGFVLQVVFGKAYSLVPSYFDRDLATALGPVGHLPLSVLGVLGLALGPLERVPAVVESAGTLLWGLGVLVFLVTMLATIRTNLTGAETGTGEHNADRRPVDRIANLFVPVVFGYLAWGTWETLAATTGLPTLVGPYRPRATHLLAAGTGAVLVFAVGFRLLPRFLVAHLHRGFPAVVLPAGAVGPAIIAFTLPSGPIFRAGAALEALAVSGFAVAYLLLWTRSDRDRVGFYGPLCGVVAGVAGVGLGLWMATGHLSGPVIAAHYRLNLLGFLGLTIVGITYQFYPPAVGRFPGAGDRLALASIAALVGGIAVEVAGLVLGIRGFVPAGRIASLLGSLAYAYLLWGVFLQRFRA